MSVSRHRSDVNSTRQPKTTLALFHHSPPQNSHCASRLSRSALGDWEQHDSRRSISVLPRLGYWVGGREPASVNGQRLLLQLPRTVQKHGGNLRTKSRRKAFGGRCPHLDVDGIDEDGPYEQHPCKTKRIRSARISESSQAPRSWTRVLQERSRRRSARSRGGHSSE